MNVTVKITNAITKVVEMDLTVRMNENLDNMHRLLCEAYPDSFVNFTVDNGDFICGQPHNMAKDGDLWKEGRISWEEYATKWCPNVL